MSNAAIHIESLSKVFRLYDRHLDRLKETLHPFHRKFHRDFFALRGVSLEIQKGESIGIVGKNGSGKSTLLKLITGISPPTHGTLCVQGRISALLELGTGFNPELSGQENVFFSGMLMGLTRSQVNDRLQDIFAFADIGEYVHQPVKTYSSGMLVRLAFAVAIHVDPEILIVDEALAVGDLLFQQKCYQRLEKFRAEGKTILFVSHSTKIVNELSTRAYFLDKGELILEGPSRLVTAQYERFLFSAPHQSAPIRQEIVQLNQDPEQKQRLSCLVEPNCRAGNSPEQSVMAAPPAGAKLKKQKPCLLPELKAQSTVECRNSDVDICEIAIRTLDGEMVNALVLHEEYIYSYRVCFHVDVEQVVFGMKFRTLKGVEVLGMAAPGLPGHGKHIPRVSKGEQYRVDWRFRCLLIPGLYSTNAGVFGTAQSVDGFQNRSIDCLVFQVLEIPESNYSGIAHLCEGANIVKL